MPPPVTEGNGNSEGRGVPLEAISNGGGGLLREVFFSGSLSEIGELLIIIIPSKYFPNSDRLKAHAQFTITSY